MPPPRDPGFHTEPFEDWAQEFLASDAAGEFRADVREAGAAPLAALLHAACRRAGGGLESVEADHLARALSHDLHGQGVTAESRPQLPALAASFLGFLQVTGRLSGGASMGEALLSGAVSGQDRVLAPAADRNDPCPCGSGRKYKKCCGG